MEAFQRVSQMGQMMPYPMGGTGTDTTLLWIIILLLVIIIAYLWYTSSRRKYSQVKPSKSVDAEPIESDKIDVALRLLNENEKQVVQALIDHGGEMLQKDLTYELGLTRVQTHRAVQSLINRKIVTTEDHFNTKKVTLAEWLIK
jgi:uncharacterized protein (DUF58 family)